MTDDSPRECSGAVNQARQLVNDHVALYGHTPYEEKLVEAIGAALPRCDAGSDGAIYAAVSQRDMDPWEQLELRVECLIRCYMPELDGSPDQRWSAMDSRLMGVLNDLAHDATELIRDAALEARDVPQASQEPLALQAAREDERLACWKIAENERATATVDKAAWLVAFDIANAIKARGYPVTRPHREGQS